MHRHHFIAGATSSRKSSALFAAAALGLASIATGCSDSQPPKAEKSEKSEKAEANLADTSRLPRVSGAKEVMASPATTIFTSPDPVAKTADDLEKALTAGGWKAYRTPNTQGATDANMRSLFFKNGKNALSVYISVAPAQNNATNVQYAQLPLKFDLSFPADATQIEYSPDLPVLKFVTAGPADKIFETYRTELGKQGWSLWSARANGKQPPGGRAATYTDRGGSAYYIADAGSSGVLGITLQKADDGSFNFELKQAPGNVLASLRRTYLNGDNGTTRQIDVARLPRLAGADIAADRTSADRLVYAVTTAVPVTVPATKALLAEAGWQRYVGPLERDDSTLLYYKKGGQGLTVSFTQVPGQPDKSLVYYSPAWIYFAMPFPADATDVIFDDRRPYLNCNTSLTLDAARDFFVKALGDADWQPAQAADITARWPNAKIEPDPANGKRIYFERGGETFIVLTLQGADGGKTSADIRVPSFALPQTLEAGSGFFGLPSPKISKTAGGTNGERERIAHATVPADVGPVLDFYRREFASRNWREESQGPGANPGEIVVKFTSPEGPAVLTVGHRYDLTTVNLVQQRNAPPPAATPAQRSSNPADALGDMMKQAQDMMQGATKDIDAMMKMVPGQPAAAPPPPAKSASAVAPAAKTVDGVPVPLPDGAEDVEFDGAKGSLEFTSDAGVKAMADFYRAELKRRGWRETPSVINRPNMVVLNLSKSDRDITVTIMQMGPRTNVSAVGTGLEAQNAAAKPDAGASPGASAAADAAVSPDDLVAEMHEGLPVPKRRNGTGTGKTPFRLQIDADVPLPLKAVLEFYRRELGKLGWQEDAKAATVSDVKASLRYTSPKGPVSLKLARAQGSTTVELAIKDTDAAKQAGVLPKPGTGKILFGNILDSDASITIDKRTVKIGAGVGSKNPDGPTIDLKPGTYRYTLTRPQAKPESDSVEIGPDEIWGLMVGPGGVLALPVY